MNLLNVCYVSNFIINIVANSILVDKELHFDIEHNYLYRKSVFVILVSKIKAYYVLKNNKTFQKVNSFAVIVRKNTTIK